ncbi:MAG TPA: hypothetical protein VKF62_06715 [Planctomycetota bacterium]|nr:hypothetical protein [Planctomycetota bacterium]
MSGSRAGGPLLSALLCAACVGPKRDLWPPPPGEPRFEIDVVFHDRHTVVVERVEGRGAFREWGYAEKSWCLENKRGLSGAIRALFWPTASVLGCDERDSPLWARRAGEEVERWSFVVSRRGLEKMRAYYESERGPPLPHFPGWSEGTHAYHLFHHCHHVTAGALRAAGLPITPWWCLTGGLIRIQLDRIRRFHESEGEPSVRAAADGGATRPAR